MNCDNWLFAENDLFCTDCGQEIALHNLPKSNKTDYVKILKNAKPDKDKAESILRLQSELTQSNVLKTMVEEIASKPTLFPSIHIIVVWLILCFNFYVFNNPMNISGWIGGLMVMFFLGLTFYIFSYKPLKYSGRY